MVNNQYMFNFFLHFSCEYLKYSIVPMKKHPSSQKIRKQLGERLKQARLDAGFSQDALGKELGLTHGSIGSYERARLSITVDLLLTFCHILKKPLSYFIVNKEDLILAAEEEKRLEEKQSRYDLAENLEFTLELALRNYLRAQRVTNINEKIEDIMKYIQNIREHN